MFCCWIAALVCCLSFVSGCTVDYTASAVEKARAYALENTRGLTEYQRNHIRYVNPVIWGRRIFEHSPMTLTEYGHMARNREFTPRKSKRLNYVDMTFAWEKIPGLDCSVVVMGHSEQSGNFWEPLKLVYKKAAPIDKDYEKARSAAVAFVSNNMLNLSVEERDRVRFSEAEVALTSFDLSYLKEGKPFVRKKRTGGLESYLASLRKEAAAKKAKAAKKGSGKTEDKADAKSADKTEDKADAKSADKTDDKADAKSADKTEDKADAKSADKTEDKADAKSADKSDDKAENKAEDEKSDDKTAEKAVAKSAGKAVDGKKPLRRIDKEENSSGNTQFSLVWQADDPSRLIVLTGEGKGRKLAGWKVMSAGVMPVKVFEKYLLKKTYFSPADKKRKKLVVDKGSTVKVYRKRLKDTGKKENK